MTKKELNLYMVLEKKYQHAKQLAKIFEKDGKEKIAYGYRCVASAFFEAMQFVADKEYLKDIAEIYSLILE